MVYVRGMMPTSPVRTAVDAKLREIGQSMEARPDRNRLYYLATLPSLYEALITSIGELKRSRNEGWGRIVVEKPFGHDLESASG